MIPCGRTAFEDSGGQAFRFYAGIYGLLNNHRIPTMRLEYYYIPVRFWTESRLSQVWAGGGLILDEYGRFLNNVT